MKSLASRARASVLDTQPADESGRTIAVLVSGGLDSCILVADLLRRRRIVQPIYIRSGLIWESAERRALRRFLASIHTAALRDLMTLALPITDIYGRHWSTTGQGVPAREAPDEAVFLPGRNLLLVVKAAIWCQRQGISELALAPLGTSPFGDAQPGYFRHLQDMLRSDGQPAVRIVLPFSRMHKRQVMQLGSELPLGLTFSCISPVKTRHCGRCNKCAERQAAFSALQLSDPTNYAA